MTFRIPVPQEDEGPSEVERIFNRPTVTEDPANFSRKISRAMTDWKLRMDKDAQTLLRRKLSAGENSVFAADAEYAANLLAKLFSQHALIRTVMSAEEGTKFNLDDSYRVTKADIKSVFADASVDELMDYEFEDKYNRDNGLLSGTQAVRAFDTYLVKHNLIAGDNVRDAVLKSLSQSYYEFRAEDIEEFCYRLSLETLRRAVIDNTDINTITLKDLEAMNSAAKQQREEAAVKAVSRLIGGEGLGDVLKDVLPKGKTPRL